MRPSGRAPDQLRPVSLEPGFSRHAEGSCLVKFGDTHVLCTASIDEKVPPWMRNSGKGWVTAEYGMLPRSTHTRTASITGAWVALHFAYQRLIKDGKLAANPLSGTVAAVSCGLWEGAAVLDLDYPEDSKAEADANFVLTGNGGIVEVQGTAEQDPFSEAQFLELLSLAKKGIGELTVLQRTAVGKT